MTETLFAFDERNYQQCQNGYRGARNQEYYLGEYHIEAGDAIEVRAERKPVDCCSLVQLSARTGQSFRRGWSHIREDATDVMVLWFVRRGRLIIDHSGKRSVAGPGEFALTHSMRPFAITCETDEQARHEVLNVIVPAHQFRRYLPQDVRPGFTARGGEFALAERLLSELFTATDELPAATEQRLFDCALGVLAEAIRGQADSLAIKSSLSERRLHEVLRYIDVHMSDPQLSAAVVARACGISTRYLSTLLHTHGKPFADLLWSKRLEAAGYWLAGSRPEEISIAEIAFRTGFKSPAHFSRMFKRVYQQGPRAYRDACIARRQDDRATAEAVVALGASEHGTVQQAVFHHGALQ